MITDPREAPEALPTVESGPSATAGPRPTLALALAPEPKPERSRRLRQEARDTALAQATRQMAAFLGIAGHEIRGPLTSCILSVLLATRRLDQLRHQAAPRDAALAAQLAAVRDRLATAESGLERLTRLVGDLLDVSRLQAGQLAPHLAHAELRAVVRAAVDEQRPLAPDRRLRLHLPGGRQAPVMVWADADRLHQVVTNYLTNALKYSAADRPVDVRVRVHAGWARVSVQDRGPGLSAEEQARIWAPFHRADAVEVAGEAPRNGAAQSLGLGLYICRTIIEQHRGRVGVRSAPGRGSTFWFSLPVSPAIRLARDGPPPAAMEAA